MDGAPFLGKVAERSPDTKCMMLTGYTGLGSAMQATKAGHVCGFISKPSALDSLVGSVRDACGSITAKARRDHSRQ